MRIWIDRRALAARNLTVADVEAALKRNNLELPAGEVKSRERQLSVRLNSRIASIDDFREIVLDRVAGYPVRLGDVARIAPGVADDSTIVRNNGVEAVGMAWIAVCVVFFLVVLRYTLAATPDEVGSLRGGAAPA